MDQRRTVKKVFESKPERSRRGRPRWRWWEDLEKDLREMRVKRWRQKVVDREEWAFVIKAAKVKRAIGLSSN
jgi:hypothetical protein